jgi:4,5-dihydroxyphthalate decarboxylase
LPKKYDIQKIPSGASPEKMLLEGSLDAVILTSLFPSLLSGAPGVRRLFENYKEVEIGYFKKTGIFPIMHTVAIKEELWKKHPWIAVSLYKAFQKAKEIAYQRINDLSPYKLSMAWFREPLKEQREVLGEDPWSDGLARNRKTVETLIEYLYEQELIRDNPKVEELFAPNALALG